MQSALWLADPVLIPLIAAAHVGVAVSAAHNVEPRFRIVGSACWVSFPVDPAVAQTMLTPFVKTTERPQ